MPGHFKTAGGRFTTAGGRARRWAPERLYSAKACLLSSGRVGRANADHWPATYGLLGWLLQQSHHHPQSARWHAGANAVHPSPLNQSRRRPSSAEGAAASQTLNAPGGRSRRMGCPARFSRSSASSGSSKLRVATLLCTDCSKCIHVRYAHADLAQWHNCPTSMQRGQAGPGSTHAQSQLLPQPHCGCSRFTA